MSTLSSQLLRPCIGNVNVLFMLEILLYIANSTNTANKLVCSPLYSCDITVGQRRVLYYQFSRRIESEQTHYHTTKIYEPVVKA